ncbi:hypothetical protein ACFLTU_02535 [Bacteroidota bacterium]
MNDSIFLEEVSSLKKELGLLKKKDKSLQSKIYQLQKAQQKNLAEAEEAFAATDETMEKNSIRTSGLEEALKVSEEKAQENRNEIAAWAKKMFMILTIFIIVLFIVLLIFAITNRMRLEKGYKKLEAKVENTKEAFDIEINKVLKKHEEDIAKLKKSTGKDK